MLRAPCTSAGMATLAQLMHIACSGSTGWKSRESWASGRRKWVAKSDRKEPLPLPPNDGCSASAIIECTKCPYSRSDFSSFSPFSCSFSPFFFWTTRERMEKQGDDGLNASSQKEFEWKICKKRIHRILLFHIQGDTPNRIQVSQSQSQTNKGHLAQLLVIFP